MFNDFQKQKDIKFDIIKLRQALKQVINKKVFDFKNSQFYGKDQ